jgi:hypothetical protein
MGFDQCLLLSALPLKKGTIMDKKSLIAAFQVSRSIFVIFLFLMIGGAITKIKLLVFLGAFFASISWITPGILILLNLPRLAQSWLRGINTVWIPGEPWEQLTDWKKFLIYFYSTIFSVITIVAIANYIIQWMQR